MTIAASTTPAIRRYRAVFLALSLGLIALPLVAMAITDEVSWLAGDFLVFAAMLLALGVVIEIAIRFAPGRMIRAATIALSIAAFAFVWMMLAIG